MKLQGFPTLLVCGKEITIVSIVIDLKCPVACVSMEKISYMLYTYTYAYTRARTHVIIYAMEEYVFMNSYLLTWLFVPNEYLFSAIMQY
jgi:hypothetical protein